MTDRGKIKPRSLTCCGIQTVKIDVMNMSASFAIG